MSLPTSGRIKMSEIASEFGGSAPHKLSEYLRGGSNVKDASLNNTAGIATSGKQKITDYYGSGNPTLTRHGAYTTTGNYNQNITLSTTKRGSNTSIIIIYGANSADQGSSITFTVKDTSDDSTKTVTQLVQNHNTSSNDGSSVGVFSSNVGDVAEINVSSSGGVTNKSILVIQYDNTPSLSSALATVTLNNGNTVTLAMGTASFSASGFADAFNSQFNGTGISNTDFAHVAGARAIGYQERFGSAGDVTYTLQDDSSTRSRAGASFNI